MELTSDTAKQGLSRAPHRSLLKGIGYTDREIAQPWVGVACAVNEVIPGHTHLQQVADAVKAGVYMAGGTPMQFGVIGICDGIAMGHAGMHYSLPSRENIADSVEMMARAHAFDALVLVTNCDKIDPGMLMAAARVNIPAVVVSGGPMLAGRHRGRDVDFITVMEAQGAVEAGRMEPGKLAELEDCACPGCGSCAGLFTANSMNCLTEAIGMGLPGNGTIPAVYAERLRLAKQAGMAVMEMLRLGRRPRDIITPASLRNALAVDMAIGGSSNTVLHLLAIAYETGYRARPGDHPGGVRRHSQPGAYQPGGREPPSHAGPARGGGHPGGDGGAVQEGADRPWMLLAWGRTVSGTSSRARPRSTPRC